MLRNVELTILLSGCLAARARAVTCLLLCHLLRRRTLRKQNGESCVFKTPHGKLTALAPGLICVNVFYSRRLNTRHRRAVKNRPCVLALRLLPFNFRASLHLGFIVLFVELQKLTWPQYFTTRGVVMKGHIFLTSGQEERGSSASRPEQELLVPSGWNAGWARETSERGGENKKSVPPG